MLRAVAGSEDASTKSTNETSVTLKNAGNLLGGGITRVLSPDSGAPTHLSNAGGQWIQLKATANNIADAQIHFIAIVVGTLLHLILTNNLTTGCAVDASVGANTDLSKDDMDFEFSEVRMNVGNVETPSGYLDARISKVKSGKMNFVSFAH